MATDDKELILKELVLHSVFTPVPGRTHSCFKNMEFSIFSKVDYDPVDERSSFELGYIVIRMHITRL